MDCPPEKKLPLQRGGCLWRIDCRFYRLASPRSLYQCTRFFFPAIPNGAYRTDPNSFLFSLVNPSGLQPTKMSLIPGKESSAIHCNSGSGPRFGRGIDLHIPNAPNSNNCSVNLNNTYQLPPGQNANTFLTGNQNFTLAELEIFKFEK